MHVCQIHLRKVYLHPDSNAFLQLGTLLTNTLTTQTVTYIDYSLCYLSI